MNYCPVCGEKYPDERVLCSAHRVSLLSLPTDVPTRLTMVDNLLEVWSKAEIEKLRSRGEALRARGSSGTCYVPQHHALSFEQLQFLLSGYETIARNFRQQVVFRGQTRDYFTSAGDLVVFPGVARGRDTYWDYQMNGAGLDDDLRKWLRVLDEMGLRTDSGLRFRASEPNSYGTYTELSIGHVGAVLGQNLVVASILQHYGFPTEHLDVTTDLGVALWFALHTSRTRDGRISFEPGAIATYQRRVKQRRPLDCADVATLHVYFAPTEEHMKAAYPVVDLRACEALTTVAARPVRQAAWSMPCGRFHFTPHYRELPTRYIQRPVGLRAPVAVFKLYFPFEDVGRPELTAAQLFPTSEPLYRSLLEAGVPRLAIYCP